MNHNSPSIAHATIDASAGAASDPVPAGRGISRLALVLGLAAALALPGMAGARVFQCEKDGQIVFQDKSCDGLAAPEAESIGEEGAAGSASSPAAATPDAAPGARVEPASPEHGASEGAAAVARLEPIAVQAFEALRAGNVQAYLRLCTCPRGVETDTPGGSNQLTLPLPNDALDDARGMVEDIREQGLTLQGESVGDRHLVILRLDARRRVLDRPARVVALFDWRDGDPCLIRIERSGLAGAAE